MRWRDTRPGRPAPRWAGADLHSTRPAGKRALIGLGEGGSLVRKNPLRSKRFRQTALKEPSHSPLERSRTRNSGSVNWKTSLVFGSSVTWEWLTSK